jgi:hypothetical protein
MSRANILRVSYQEVLHMRAMVFDRYGKPDYKLLLIATLAVIPLLAVFKRSGSSGADGIVVVD